MLFDTSVVIDILRKRREYQYGSISEITLLEIIRGVRDNEMAETLVLLKQMFHTYDIDDNVIVIYSKLYNMLKQKGKTIPDADLIIIATAHAKNETLLTKDRGLKIVSDIVDIKIE